MSDFTCYVGEQIRQYRKAGKMTMQELADAIHKSRATICKYESGEISVDIETLYEISQVLQVSISQLTTYLPESVNEPVSFPGWGKKSPFFQARRLYLYFYSRYVFTDSYGDNNRNAVCCNSKTCRKNRKRFFTYTVW